MFKISGDWILVRVRITTSALALTGQRSFFGLVSFAYHFSVHRQTLVYDRT